MVKGHTHLILLGSRALSSASSALAGEASAALSTTWRQNGQRHISPHTYGSGASADSSPSTSSIADQSSGRALRQQWTVLNTAVFNSSLWRHGPTVASPPFTSSATIPTRRTHPAFLGALSAGGFRSLHVSSAAAVAASGATSSSSSGGGGGGGGPEPPSEGGSAGAAGASAGPVQNPLQAALAAASGTQQPAMQAGGVAGSSRSGRRRERRTWMWYDEDDEREERRHEVAREQYLHVGTAYMSNITQSVKKMNRIVRLVRGLSYADAVAQCKMVPHKAARHVLQALEAAHQDATQAVGLDAERLVVGIIYATRGRVEKAMQRMGRGRSGKMFTRSSHLRVVLRESRERPSAAAFKMRQVTPLMGIMSGAAAPASAAWLARGPAAATRAALRPRFAYRVEA